MKFNTLPLPIWVCPASPSAFITPSEAVADLGDSVSLDCTASGSPQPTVSWSAPRYSPFSLPAGAQVSQNRLQIIDFAKDHVGDYVCTATNRHGVETALVSVHLAGNLLLLQVKGSSCGVHICVRLFLCAAPATLRSYVGNFLFALCDILCCTKSGNTMCGTSGPPMSPVGL